MARLRTRYAPVSSSSGESTLIINDCKVLGTLGSGSFGEVLLCRRTSGELVALKALSKSRLEKKREIKNIDGVKQTSKQFELNNKFKIEEINKEVTIGKEQKKLVPTDMGLLVNEFMMKNFAPIMDIEFTANFETYLDKIAIGKANWVTVLRIFYDMFNPIVENDPNSCGNLICEKWNLIFLVVTVLAIAFIVSMLLIYK
jgi:serine/threonine protein kinase